MVAAVLDDTDPWQLGGNGPIIVQYTGIGLTIAPLTLYWLEMASPGGGAGGDEIYYYGGILVDAQLSA